MSFTLEVVDWRDSQGTSHPEYHREMLKRFLHGARQFRTRAEAEKAAEAAWIEPDCRGVAPVCVVTECDTAL
jgi:hypothetical protein